MGVDPVEGSKAMGVDPAADERPPLGSERLPKDEGDPRTAGPDGAAGESQRLEVESKLVTWANLKRTSNFVAADKIRNELKAMGLPSHELPLDFGTSRPRSRDIKRPKTSESQGAAGESQPRPGGPEVEKKLDTWAHSKRAKDYVAADKIRDELKALGVDCEEERGKHGTKKPTGDRDERPREDLVRE